MKKKENNLVHQKKQNLYIFLSGLFLTNALIAEVVGTKIFSLEKTLGINPAQISLPIWDSPLDFNLTAGVVLWPVVFIMTDIINEYYGKKGVRKISFLTAGFIAYAFFMIWVVTGLSPAEFWVKINNPLDINTAFNRIFLQSMGIIIGSLTAFLLGQIIDVVAFQWLRKFTGSKNLWLRATGSTLISQFIDSFVVLFIAFYFFGNPKWSFNQVISVGIINYIYKFSVALLLTPLLYVVHYLIDSYLGKNVAHEMIEEASNSELF
ncbi:queuosine precursor transporter [Bernardetia sp. ABR2-2B]|uniref:queuosine precursor transporter n=1 Tax=Bernardetia sp. ABR2-2B TaxID=3127472 RepID=UPI0030D0F888